MAKDNPKLKRNGGEGTFLGKALGTLKDVSPALLDIIGTAIPGVSGLSNILGSVLGDKETPQATKDILIAEIEKDISMQVEITKRWESDNKAAGWLPRNIRPTICLLYTLATLFFIYADSNIEGFEVDSQWITLLIANTGLINTAYFGSKYMEKRDARKYK